VVLSPENGACIIFITHKRGKIATWAKAKNEGEGEGAAGGVSEEKGGGKQRRRLATLS